MTYDIYGKWDQYNDWTGPYVFGHINTTSINAGLDLLRRNDVDLSKVNFGIGFYGLSLLLILSATSLDVSSVMRVRRESARANPEVSHSKRSWLERPVSILRLSNLNRSTASPTCL
jgi:hypothetical protein